MNVIIVGCGRVGQTLAAQLGEEGNNVTVVDTDAEAVKALTERYDVMGVTGNGATHTVLEEAGIANADLLIAVTGSDELNLLCCLVAKKEGRCQTIARVESPAYSAEASYLKDELGLAMVINPVYAAAQEISRVLRFPSAIKIETFAKGMVELLKFRLPETSRIVGMSVKEVVMKLHCDVLICTVERGNEAFNVLLCVEGGKADSYGGVGLCFGFSVGMIAPPRMKSGPPLPSGISTATSSPPS